MGRFVLWLVALILDHRANGCHQVHHHLARFSILEIHARSIHAHWVDATHDEHAVVYHDVVAESHAADGARGRACSQLSFVEKRCVRYRSNGVGEDSRARALEQFRAPLGNVSQFRQRATAPHVDTSRSELLLAAAGALAEPRFVGSRRTSCRRATILGLRARLVRPPLLHRVIHSSADWQFARCEGR